jgi:ring-1,2-phenylacetyl-CoA epoxidase subunit PaaE
MSRAAAFVRAWFAEPAPTFELRTPSARWGKITPHAARRALRVVEVIDETPSTRTFVLEPTDGARPLDYRAGQHLTLLVDIAGVTHRRCYSFSSSPASSRRPSVTVRRTPAGLVSRHLHERIRAGDTLVATDPSGQFTIATNPALQRTIAFVAGGVGITPLISLAETLLREEPQSRAVLLCGNRCEDEIIFRERLGALESEFARRLVVRHALDQPPANWSGVTGALDGARTLQLLGRTDADAFYVCGPEAMMTDVCSALASAGVAADRVRTERFAYASVTTTRIPTHFAEVTFAASGRRVTAKPGQTILQAGLEAGIDLPSSCTMGGCGACKVRKTSGTVVMSEPNCLSDREREAGYLLACCSYADSNLTIENH